MKGKTINNTNNNSSRTGLYTPGWNEDQIGGRRLRDGPTGRMEFVFMANGVQGEGVGLGLNCGEWQMMRCKE